MLFSSENSNNLPVAKEIDGSSKPAYHRFMVFNLSHWFSKR